MKKIIEKVKKLLAKGSDKSVTEAEAAAFMEKAYAMLAEHNISMDAVQDKSGQLQEKREEQRTPTNWSEKYYLDVWSAVADLNACFLWSYRPNPKKRETRMIVFGRQSNVILTTTMANYLCETMRRLGRQAAKDAYRSDFAFTNSYLYGMGGRLVERLRQLRREASAGTAKGSETGTTLPALADHYKSEYRANYIACYGTDPYDHPVAAREETAVAKVETETEKAARLKKEAKEEKEWQARQERARAREDKFREYLVSGGGFNKGRRDADNISLNRQVDKGDPLKEIK